MGEVLRPMLELSVLFPGVLLAYLPMKNHLRFSHMKTVVIMAGLLVLLCAGGGGLCYYLDIRTIWVVPPMILLTAIVYVHSLTVSPLKSVNVVLAICAVYACLHSVARAMDAMLTPQDPSAWFSVGAGLVYLAMCTAFTLIAWYPATHAVVELLDEDHIAQTWYIFWILPMVFLGLNLFMIPTYPDTLYQGQIMQGYIVISLILLAILGLFYALFYFTARSLDKNYRLRQENQFLAMQRAQYENLQTAIKETRQARHDMRHHFNQLSAMAEDGNWKELQQYLNTVQGKIPNMDIHFSENHAADSVVGHYCTLAKRENIPFTAQIDLPRKIPTDEMDLCLVLSNLLENALEASLRIKDSLRWIHVTAHLHSEKILLITVENAFDGELSEKDGVFQSSKRKGSGIGIQSVQRIAYKDGGDCRFCYEDGVFSAKVMLRKMNAVNDSEE